MRSRNLLLTAAFAALGTLTLAPAGLAQEPEHKGKGRPGARLIMLFKRLDTDKDGKVTEAEAGRLWARLSQLDTNNDKAVDKKEIAAAIKKGRKGKKNKGRPGARLVMLFKRLDTDKDGKVTEAEAGRLWARLSRLDTNNDKAVDKKEIAAAIKKGKGRRGRKPL